MNMNKTVKILTFLLATQLLLAVGIGLSDRGVTATKEPVTLLSFDVDKIDHITLEGPDGEKVTLARKDKSWLMPDLDDFPANNNRVEQLIQQLGGLRSSTPVATSKSARDRFKVSEEQFERRITLSQGDNTIARLYLGSSPSMHYIYARNAASDAIYAVKAAAYDVPVKASDWEDRSVLTFSKSSITTMDINGLHIVHRASDKESDKAANGSSQTPQWQASGLPEGKQLKESSVDKLAGLLAGLQFEKVLGREAKDEYGMKEPVLELSLTRDGGEVLTYRVGKTKNKEAYTLKVSNRPEYFRLAGYKAKPLIESASLEALTETPPKTGEEEAISERPSDP